jgi:hypothetical protein
MSHVDQNLGRQLAYAWSVLLAVVLSAAATEPALACGFDKCTPEASLHTLPSFTWPSGLYMFGILTVLFGIFCSAWSIRNTWFALPAFCAYLTVLKVVSTSKSSRPFSVVDRCCPQRTSMLVQYIKDYENYYALRVFCENTLMSAGILLIIAQLCLVLARWCDPKISSSAQA